ncbi:MAG: GDSL-type esterase/lipase family protein [Verrucomicrobia bacterium]|nr:GDSL-type esterase/lipase family protein [Verrucomicrobiota bacterium]
MKLLRSVITIALLAFAATGFAADAAFPLGPAQECRPREGWPNFFAKATKPGSEVTIAYFGGSITAQPGWRPKTLAHFRQAFPDAKFHEINAAIGGTGSDLGVFRLKQDVLDRHPDLVLVEFAVNDGGASPEQIFRCMEGIVSQIWRAAPDCDIGFVYTLTEALAPAMLEGNFQRSASAMERIADHYGIPSIHLAMEVARLAKDGRLVWKAPLPKTDAEKAALGDKVVFAPDAVHPYPETGHELYLQAVVRSLGPVRAASGPARPHRLGAPYVAANYERAQLLPLSAATLSAGFVPLDPRADPFGKRWADRLPAVYRATQAGGTVTFRFKGTRCAIYDVIGPDGGQVRVTLDDRPPETRARFDAYCTYHRLSTFLIGTELPDTVHTVKIELLGEPLDKAAILAQRHQTIADPKLYAPLSFHPGAILLVGELLKP